MFLIVSQPREGCQCFIQGLVIPPPTRRPKWASQTQKYLKYHKSLKYWNYSWCLGVTFFGGLLCFLGFCFVFFTKSVKKSQSLPHNLMVLGSRACVQHCPAIHRPCVLGEWVKVTWFSYKNKTLQEPFLSSSLKLEDKLLLQNLAVNFSFWKNARGAQVKECVGFWTWYTFFPSFPVFKFVVSSK